MSPGQAVDSLPRRASGKPTFAFSNDATFSFPITSLLIFPTLQPVHAVNSFSCKTDEATGWQPLLSPPAYLIDNGIITLASPLNLSRGLARINYTGGYILPSDTPNPLYPPLPPVLAYGAIEQVAFWFTHRKSIGLRVYSEPGENYTITFQNATLIPEVQRITNFYRRVVF